ncbi:MAG: nuclease, partial [Halobacteriaceae archaeon]
MVPTDVTLDPVHLEGIADLARNISRTADESDQRDLAETVWENYLDPLYADGEIALEPLGHLERFSAPIEAIGLQDDPFETIHGIDSGTINPRTFKNGL